MSIREIKKSFIKEKKTFSLFVEATQSDGFGCVVPYLEFIKIEIKLVVTDSIIEQRAELGPSCESHDVCIQLMVLRRARFGF